MAHRIITFIFSRVRILLSTMLGILCLFLLLIRLGIFSDGIEYGFAYIMKYIAICLYCPLLYLCGLIVTISIALCHRCFCMSQSKSKYRRFIEYLISISNFYTTKY